MGLDISYYVDAKAAPFDGDIDDLDNYVHVTVLEDIPAPSDGLDHGSVYSFRKSGGFRAGSYSGYNAWRDQLAELAGYPSTDAGSQFGHSHAAAAWKGEVAEDAPFFPLINYSDCDGTIGPKTSARLAKDFADFQDKADGHPDSYFREKYAVWRAAFEAVADNGFISFH